MKFTEIHIPNIKSEITTIISSIRSGDFSFQEYLELNIINKLQYFKIEKFIATNCSINLEPLPYELIPLIDIAKHIIIQENKKPKPKPKKFLSYTGNSFYSYDNDDYF